MEGHGRYLSSEMWQLIFSGVGEGDLNALSLVCKDFLTYSNPLKESLKPVHPKTSMLSRHLNRFTRLKAINLLDFKGDIDEAIREIERSGISSTSLESLDILIPIENIWGQLLESLRGCGPNLKSLNCKINRINHMHECDSGVLVLTNTFPNLEQLRIENCWETLTGFGFERLKLLKKIHLYDCQVSDEFLVALSLNCVLLKDVNILSGYGVAETGVAHLLRNRPTLEALSIDWIKSNSTSPHFTIENSISHAKALTSLVLALLRNTNKVLSAIAKAKLRLNNLGLKSCKGLTVSGLLAVLSGHLTTLRIDSSGITNEDMEVLLSKDVSKLIHIVIDEIKVTESTLFLLLTKCPSLVEINMKLYRPQRFNEISLSKNHNIRSLCLDVDHEVNIINDEFAKKIGLTFPNLKVLSLNHCEYLTATGVEAILQCCKHITELTLSWFECNNLFDEASNCSNLLNLEVLSLPWSSINDEGLAVISKKCPHLLSLDLSGSEGITTEGVKQVVQNIKTLASLTVHYNDNVKYGALLNWMLSTSSNLASLNKICLPRFTMEYVIDPNFRDEFLERGCLLLHEYRWCY